MNLRVVTAATIFVGSYLPLSMILLAQSFNPDYFGLSVCWKYLWAPPGTCTLPIKNPLSSLGIFFACLICFSITLGAFAILPAKRNINVHKAKHVPAELMNYVLPYVVAFMNLDYGDGGRLTGFAIFLIWIFWITYKSGQIILNPLLTVFGWKLYDIEYSYAGSESVQQGMCLARGPILPKTSYRYGVIQDVTIITKREER